MAKQYGVAPGRDPSGLPDAVSAPDEVMEGDAAVADVTQTPDFQMALAKATSEIHDRVLAEVAFEAIDLRGGPERLGAGRKSFLLTLALRRADRTLTSAEADEVCQAVVAACAAAHDAQLRA